MERKRYILGTRHHKCGASPFGPNYLDGTTTYTTVRLSCLLFLILTEFTLCFETTLGCFELLLSRLESNGQQDNQTVSN